MKNPKAKSLVCAAVAAVLLAALTLPSNSEYLLGRGPDDVIALFGVPDHATAGNAAMMFTYNATEGATGTFVFHHGVAVRVPDEGFTPAQIKRPKPGEVFAGQSVAAAVAVLGNASDCSQSNLSATLQYANGQSVMLIHGRVFPSTK